MTLWLYPLEVAYGLIVDARVVPGKQTQPCDLSMAFRRWMVHPVIAFRYFAPGLIRGDRHGHKAAMVLVASIEGREAKSCWVPYVRVVLTGKSEDEYDL